MQRTEIINKNGLFKIVEKSFMIGKVQFYESYSDYESDIIKINNLSQFENYYEKKCKSTTNIGFGLYYPEAKGKFRIEKIKLDPKYCDGKKFRFQISGWGIIYIHLNIKNPENEIECRIAVNSERRATIWKGAYWDYWKMKSPKLWDWEIVNSNARKLIHPLKKLAIS